MKHRSTQKYQKYKFLYLNENRGAGSNTNINVQLMDRTNNDSVLEFKIKYNNLTNLRQTIIDILYTEYKHQLGDKPDDSWWIRNLQLNNTKGKNITSLLINNNNKDIYRAIINKLSLLY